jgi:hypothetical protein
METDPNELMVPADAPPLSLVKATGEQMAQAVIVSKQLVEFIDNCGLAPVVFPGSKKEHLWFEHWQFIGTFFGVTTRVTDVKEISDKGGTGFQATAVAVNSEGVIVGGAISRCMESETKGSKQQWMGKPGYSIMGMAQTRACARSLRQLFGWVVQLAEYSPTPAEEMDGSAHSERREKLRERLDAEGIVDKFLSYYRSKGWQGETLEDLDPKHVKQCLNGIETLVKKVHAYDEDAEPAPKPKPKPKAKPKPKDERPMNELEEDEVPF